MDTNELKVLVKWMYRKGDDHIPTSKQDLQSRWIATKNRFNISCTDYLISQGFEEEQVNDLTVYPTAQELTIERR